MEQTTNITNDPAQNHDLKLVITIPFAQRAKQYFSTLIISHLIAWRTLALLPTGVLHSNVRKSGRVSSQKVLWDKLVTRL
jgi:hypothetical protein